MWFSSRSMRRCIAALTSASSGCLSRPKVDSAIFSMIEVATWISRFIHISRPSRKKMWKPSPGENTVAGRPPCCSSSLRLW